MASRRKRVWAAVVALAVVLLCGIWVITDSGLFLCMPRQPGKPPASPQNPDSLAIPGVPGGVRKLDPPATIRIATFNIQNFGKKKLQNGPVVARLVQIIGQYDLVAVQEVSDIDGKVPVEFLGRINTTGRHYQLALSERTGKQPDDKTAQEQYAFYYDDSRIEKVDDRLFDDSEHDLFQREPYVARFRAKGGRFTFVLIMIHTQPAAALAEITALHQVVRWAKQRYPDEDDFIVLGDFNAGKRYVKPGQLSGLELRGAGYTWIVPDDADTNLANSREAHDRIVVTLGAREDFTGKWKVDNCFTDRGISDHWPVWAEFYMDRDTNSN